MFSISQSFFDKTKIAMMICDAAGAEILAVNAAAARSMGCTSEDLAARVMSQILYERLGLHWTVDDVETRSDIEVSDVTFENRSAKLVILHDAVFERAEVHQDRVDAMAVRLRQAQHLARIGHWEIDLNTRAVTWSHEIYRMFGLDRDSCGPLGPDGISFVHPDDKEAVKAKIQRAVETQGPYESVHRILRADGDIGFVREIGEISNTGIFHGITQDITDIHDAQTAMENTLQLMKDAGEMAKVGGWEYNAQTGLITRSAMVARIADMPDHLSIPIEAARQLYTSRYLEKHSKMWEDCLTKGIGFDEVMELVSAKGVQKWVRISGTAIEEEGGITGIRGALQDISEIISARQQIDAMHLRLEETLEGIADSFMILNRQFEVTFANQTACALLGLSKTDMLGHSFWSLFPEGIGTAFHKRYAHAMRTGETQRFRAQSPRSGKWLDITASATSHGLAISARDVTEDHARDQQLHLLEMAVSRLNDMVMISDANTVAETNLDRFVFANKAFERIMGYSTAEIIGQTAELLRGPETQKDRIAQIQAAVERKEPLRCEIINYTKAGDPIWLELDIVPIKMDDGSVSHWVSVARDISDRKRNDARLRLSEERFRLVAGASDDVIWDCDLQSGAMWWNDKLLPVFGYDAGSFTDKLTWWDANLHPDDQEVILKQMQSIIDGRDEFWALQYRFRKADGSYAHVHDRGSILRDEHGIATRILGNMTDITDRLQLEEQLRQSQKMEAIGKLTGGVAHDFNNLLAIVMGNLELLKEEMRLNERPPEDAYDLIDAGIAAVKRGSDLTNQMLAYARKARLAPVDTDVNKIVRETQSWMRRTIDKNIAIETKLCEDLWTTRIDPNSLQNAIVNMLLNARDALSDGGRIVIETQNIPQRDSRIFVNELPEVAHGYVMLSVSDNGAGISTTDLARVFDPFFTTKPVGKGSGLGLSMVQGFVKQSDGEIRVSSALGQGTRLEMFFKAEANEELPTRTLLPVTGVGNETGSGHVPRSRILLVEDELEVQRMLERTLSSEGYDVVTADTGNDALGIFQNDMHFDLILTDISMPGQIDGFELAKACREIDAEIPIIFLSGHANEDSPDYVPVIADGLCLMKPLARTDLLQAVRTKVRVKDRVT